MEDGFNDPVKREKALKALLWTAPLMFAFGYGFVYLVAFRPTHGVAMILGAASAGLNLVFAATLAMFGREWMSALRVLAIGAAAITALLNACSSR